MTSIWNSFESNSNNPANFNLDRQLSKLNLSSELISTSSSETSTLITPTTSSGNLAGKVSEIQKEPKMSTGGSGSTINNNDTLAMMSLIPNLWADKASNDKSKEPSTTPISSTTLTPSTSIVSSTAMETSANNISQFHPIQKQQQQQPNQQPSQPQSNGAFWSSSTSPVAQIASAALPNISVTPMNLNQLQLLPHELMIPHSPPAVSQQYQTQQMEQQQHQQPQQMNGFYSSQYSQQLPQNISPSFLSSHSVPMMVNVQQQLPQMPNGSPLSFPLTEENLSLLGQSASTRSTVPQATQMFNPSNNLYQMQTQGLGQPQHHQQPLQYDFQSQPRLKRSQSPSVAFKQQAQLNQQAAANAAAANAQSKSGKNNIDKELYKSEMCAQFQTKGSCPYGSKCQFAHGEFELKQVKRAVNWKTKPCTNWAKTGECRYGKRCCFKHGDEDNGAQPSSSSKNMGEKINTNGNTIFSQSIH